MKQSWKPWKPTGEGWREGQVEGLQTDSHALVWQSETLSESLPCRGLSMCHLSASCLCFPRLSERPGVQLQEPEGRCRACTL